MLLSHHDISFFSDAKVVISDITQNYSIIKLQI